MKSKKIKWFRWGIILTIMTIASAFLVVSIQKNKEEHNIIPEQEEILVSVDGEKILKKEIDLAYEQFQNSGIQYEEILNNSIDEVLVIKRAKEFGIPEITESEVQAQLQDYKAQYPELYNEAVEIYGVEELYKGQKSRMTYERVKKYVMSNILQDNITDKMVKDFIVKYSLKEQLEECSMEQIKQSLQKEIEEFLFDNWVEDIREDADIVYY